MFTEVIDPTAATRVITGWLLGTFVLLFSYALNVSPVNKNSSVSIYAAFLTPHSKLRQTTKKMESCFLLRSDLQSVLQISHHVTGKTEYFNLHVHSICTVYSGYIRSRRVCCLPVLEKYKMTTYCDFTPHMFLIGG